jgi:hypothetical protein
LGDIAPVIMQHNRFDSGAIQLKRFIVDVSKPLERLTTLEPIALEPIVPLHFVRVDRFQNHVPFDRVFLTHSPGYTPPSADALIDVVRRYIDIEAGAS